MSLIGFCGSRSLPASQAPRLAGVMASVLSSRRPPSRRLLCRRRRRHRSASPPRWRRSPPVRLLRLRSHLPTLTRRPRHRSGHILVRLPRLRRGRGSRRRHLRLPVGRGWSRRPPSRSLRRSGVGGRRVRSRLWLRGLRLLRMPAAPSALRLARRRLLRSRLGLLGLPRPGRRPGSSGRRLSLRPFRLRRWSRAAFLLGWRLGPDRASRLGGRLSLRLGFSHSGLDTKYLQNKGFSRWNSAERLYT